MKFIVSMSVLLSVLCMTYVLYAAGEAKVILTWNANIETDLAGYKVYRGTGACAVGPLQPLMVNNIHVNVAKSAAPTYTDTTVPKIDGDVCYEVTAYDTALNESPRSNRATKTVNLNPPVAPIGLTIVSVTVEP